MSAIYSILINIISLNNLKLYLVNIIFYNVPRTKFADSKQIRVYYNL